MGDQGACLLFLLMGNPPPNWRPRARKSRRGIPETRTFGNVTNGNVGEYSSQEADSSSKRRCPGCQPLGFNPNLFSRDAHLFTALSVMLEGYCAEWWTSLWARTPCDSL